MFEILPMNRGPDLAKDDTGRESSPLVSPKGSHLTVQKTNNA